ncbi:MAG: pyridoxal kinase PdxY [Pseudomonadota bacterium]
MSENNERPSVISISSHVARGSVGNRGAVFALESFGFPVWSVPTVILPWHPGHGYGTRIVPESSQFTALMEDLANAPWINEVEAVLTGYLANPEQVQIIADFLDKLRENNPDLIQVCDPVIGDTEGLYVAEETASAIRDYLLPRSEILTPNRFELKWLCGQSSGDDLKNLAEMAQDIASPFVLVTSAPGKADKEISNLFVSDKQHLMAHHEKIKNPPHGTGDLTAAVFLANLLSGLEFRENLQLTTASVFEVLKNAAERGSEELMLETDMTSLLDPQVEIEVREL